MLRQASSESVGIKSKMDRISCAWPPITLTREAVMWASYNSTSRPSRSSIASFAVFSRSSHGAATCSAAMVLRMCATRSARPLGE